jgi:Fur family transcriptional regulator, ferric uptake regulator
MQELRSAPESLSQVQSIFTSYLEERSLRKTPERYAILEEVYTNMGHFDVEKLYFQMKQKNYGVSRATVYNTLNLLSECNLVVKHQFSSGTAMYEKSYGYRQHDHLICLNCQKVTEFCDPRVGTIQDKVGSLLQYQISHHSLIFYGQCLRDNCENLPNA